MKNLMKALIIAAFAVTALPSCDKDPVNNDCICTEEYNPVCADGVTYSNPCYAGCAGATDYTVGECD